MKRTFILYFAILFLGFSTQIHAQYGMESVNHKAFNINHSIDSGDNCAGGEIHDDGTFEGGVGWASVTTEASFVIKFKPSSYPWQYNKFCVALGRVSYVTPGMMFNIVVYDSTGSGGTPGNLIYHLDSQQVSNIPVIPVYQFFSFSNLNIPPLTGGYYYIGIRYNPSDNNYLKYSANDIDCPYWPGFYWSNFQPYWTPIEQGFPYGYRCLGYRTEGISLVGISGNNNIIPKEYYLYQNYPNPFNPETKIKFSIPEQSNVLLKIYDVLGNEVVTLINENLVPGTYEKTFDASALASGVYFYKIQAGKFNSIKKMALIK